MTLDEIKNIAIPACEKFNVKRLDIFGSFARNAETPSSDIDLLVEFDDPETKISKRFFGLLHELEDTLHCQIDLLTINSLKNPYFRRNVMNSRINIYEG